MKVVVTGVVAGLGVAAFSFAASAETGPGSPRIAASLSGASDVAALARDQLIKDAVAELQRAQAKGDSEAYARPWHEMSWLAQGKGKVGRLYDLCTGAVEPPPRLSVGSWTWQTLDPRGLSSGDRRKLVNWQAQQVIAQYGCGTVFQIGTLSSDAYRALRACPTRRADNGVREIDAFIAYVHQRVALRGSDDMTSVLVEALRADGCS